MGVCGNLVIDIACDNRQFAVIDKGSATRNDDKG